MALIPLLTGLLAGIPWGCSGDKPIASQPGDGGASAACGDDADCAAWEICEASACVDGDRNNSPEEAVSVLWEDGGQGYINPAGDVDYYALSAAGGEFLRVRTVHEYEPGDTVLTLRDPTGKIVTTSDDYPTGGSVGGADSTIYAYLTVAGEYLIQVEDRGSYYGEDAVGDSAYLYTLEITEWELHSSESDGQGEPGLELTLGGFDSFAAIGVVLEEDGDTDWVELSHELDGGWLQLYSMLDLSGSEAEPRVQVYSAGGELLLDQADFAGGAYAYYPAADPGTYQLALGDTDDQGSEQHWYFVFAIMRDAGGSYPLEAEPNDNRGQADPLSMQEAETDSGNTYAYAQVSGFIDDLGDEDWFLVPERPEAELALCLSSSPGGSLVAPVIEVYDTDGELLASVEGDASASPTAHLDDLFLGTGPHYIRVVDPVGEHAGGGAWYRMVVYTTDFDVYAYEDGGYSCPG